DDRGRVLLFVAHFLGYVVAVHSWHMCVQDHKAKRIFTSVCLCELFQCFTAALRQLRLMCHSSSKSRSTSRLAALSSTTNTRRSRRSSVSGRRNFEAGDFCAANSAVKWNVLPTPGWLSTQMRPPISPTRREVIASPRPVP